MDELTERLGTIERRVRTLLAENGALAGRVAELEQQLAEARERAGDLDDYRTRRTQIRERLEGILRTLEAAGNGGPDRGE